MKVESLAIKTHKMRVCDHPALLRESGLGDEAINEIDWTRDSAVHGNFSGRIGDEEVGGCDGSEGVIS